LLNMLRTPAAPSGSQAARTRMAPDRPPPAESSRRQCCGLLSCIGFVLVLGTVLFWYGPQRFLRQLLRLLPREPGWDWHVGLCALTLVSIVLCLPIWPPLCMASGLLFGAGPGTGVNFIAVYGASVASFLLGRWLLAAPIRQWVERCEYPELRRMVLVLEDDKESLKFQVLYRFLFMPIGLRNYVPATLKVPLWKLMLSAIPHSVYISFMFASLGCTFDSSAQLIRQGREVSLKDLKWQQLLIFIVAAAMGIALAVYAQRKYTEHLRREETTSLAGSASSRAV